jgi:predicted permease
MFFGKRRPQDDFSDEILAHLEFEIEQLRAEGLSEEEARARARLRFGNLTRVQERFYESSRWEWLDTLFRNVRFGARMMARTPVSSLIAVLVLALGIGANTAIFTLLNAVLLRSLPVEHPEELVLFGEGNSGGAANGLPDRSWELFSWHAFQDFHKRNSVFSDLAALGSAYFGMHAGVAGSSDPEKVNVELASGTFFRTLGVKPTLGRTLEPADDGAPGTSPVAVASYSYWQRRFGESPLALGAAVTMNETTYRIVGVAPKGFFGAIVGQLPDLWVPVTMWKEISPGWNGLDNNLFQTLYLFGRLKPGVSREQAGANVNLLFQQMVRGYAGPTPSRKQLDDIRHARVELTPGGSGISHVGREYFSPLLILMTAAGIVLLIACTNVANLLLARAAARQQEFAIRRSIGAARKQLVQQLLIEGALLGAAGAALGLALAWGMGKALLAMVSAGGDVTTLDLLPDARILVFTVALTVCTVLLFAVAPALRATRTDPAGSLRRGRGIAQNRLASGLIVGQVALSLALLCGAGLFLRSLINLMHVDIGFDDRNVMTAWVDAPGYRDDARLRTMMARVEETVGAIPGVHAAAFAFSTFNGMEWTQTVKVTGRPVNDHDPSVHHSIGGYQFLDATGMRILAGRGLTRDDTATSPKVAVISETMARDYFPGVSPIGKHFSIGADPPWQNIEVVGVVKDAKYMMVDEETKPAAFYPETQHNGFLSSLVIRYSGETGGLVRQVRSAVASVDSGVLVTEFKPLDEIVDRSMTQQRVLAQLATAFAALAALLACVGIYGVMSYGIARRTNEFGIRMALGAERREVLGLVLRETITLAAIGTGCGLVIALASGRLVNSVLFGLQARDPWAIGIATALMIAVTLGAGWVPARRATRIDPMVALRHE